MNTQILSFAKSTKKRKIKMFTVGSIATLLAACNPIASEDIIAKSTGDVQGTPSNNDDVITLGADGKDTSVSTGAGNDLISGGIGADNIKAGSGDDVVNGGHGDDVIEGGSGIDLIRGGQGEDQMLGGAGVDNFVVVGMNQNGSYDSNDVTNPNGLDIDLSSLINADDVNNNSESDVANGGIIDGGADGANLFVYGTVDFSNVTLINITVIYVNSTLTMTATQLNGLIADGMEGIVGDGETTLILTSETKVEVNLSDFELSKIGHLTIGRNVTLIVDQDDIASVLTIDGDGKLKAVSGELDMAGKTIGAAVTILDSFQDLLNFDTDKMVVGGNVSPVGFVELSAGDSVEYKVFAIANLSLTSSGTGLGGQDLTIVDLEELLQLDILKNVPGFNDFLSTIDQLTISELSDYFDQFEDYFSIKTYTLTQSQYDTLSISSNQTDNQISGYSVIATITNGENVETEVFKFGVVATGNFVTGDAGDNILTISSEINFVDGNEGVDTLVLSGSFDGYGYVAVGDELYQFHSLFDQLENFTESTIDEIITEVLNIDFDILHSIENLQYSDQTISVADLNILKLPTSLEYNGEYLLGDDLALWLSEYNYDLA